MEYLGLVDGPEGSTQEAKPTPTRREVRVAPVTSVATNTANTGVTVLGGRTAIEVDPIGDLEPSYNIVTLHPRSYSEARQMAEHYRQGNPVIINLDDMDESERKRQDSSRNHKNIQRLYILHQWFELRYVCKN